MPVISDKQARLAARVKAVNAVRAVSREYFGVLRKAVEPFVGQKVFKKDGGLMRNVERALPPLPNVAGERVGVSMFLGSTSYFLAWTVKARVMVEGVGTSLYHSESLHVGNVDNGVLANLYDKYEGRDDFTVEEIEQKREAFKAAQQAMRDARSDLFPFGESDT